MHLICFASLLFGGREGGDEVTETKHRRDRGENIRLLSSQTRPASLSQLPCAITEQESSLVGSRNSPRGCSDPNALL